MGWIFLAGLAATFVLMLAAFVLVGVLFLAWINGDLIKG
jgi:hypothetical protein